MNKPIKLRTGISLGLILATVTLASCGDEKDPRVSDTDVACLKAMQVGLPCSAVNTNSTVATTTTTSTVTVTATTTVN